MGNDTKKTIMFNGTECTITAGPYPVNKLALCVYLNEVDTGEMYAVLSVNLGVYADDDEQHIVQRGQTFLDTNNIPDSLDILSDAGLCEQVSWYGTPHVKHSGWCAYPLVRFDMGKLAEYCPDGVAEYDKRYSHAFHVAQHVMSMDAFGNDPTWNGDNDVEAVPELVLDEIGESGKELLGC